MSTSGVLPGLNHLAFDVSGAVPPDSLIGTILKGTVNFSPATTWLQAVAWVIYVGVTMTLFFRVIRRSSAPRPAATVPAGTAS